MLCFKVSLTYQKQLLKSCVCSLDILQRWKAAWQVIHLQELIGRFANCLIDSKSNNQEIKAFCFTSQIMHQLLSLKTKLIGMISQRAVIPEDKTLWKASDLHAFFNTVWKLAYRLVTRFDAFNYDTNKIILAPIYAVMNITSTTWFLLLFLQYFVHCTHQNHFTRRLLDLYPERRDRQKQPNLPAAAYNFSWLLPSRFWYLAARSSNESHKEEIIWIQTRQYILHLPIYLLFFFPWRRGKNTRPDDALAWTQNIPSDSGSRAQMNVNVVNTSAVTLASLLSSLGKVALGSYFRSEPLWTLLQAGQCFASCRLQHKNLL